MCFCCFAALPAISQTTTSPNIILIVSDDLNDYIEPLNGHPQVQTPAMNTLAERGMTFLMDIAMHLFADHPAQVL